MLTKKNKYEEIIDIINDPYINKTNKPNVYERHIFTDKSLILIDMPPKNDVFHGSSYDFSCRKDICNIKGQIVVGRNIERDTIDKVRKLDCNVTDVHRHPEDILFIEENSYEYKKESHVHFKCENKTYNNTLTIARFLRGY